MLTADELKLIDIAQTAFPGISYNVDGEDIIFHIREHELSLLVKSGKVRNSEGAGRMRIADGWLVIGIEESDEPGVWRECKMDEANTRAYAIVSALKMLLEMKFDTVAALLEAKFYDLELKAGAEGKEPPDIDFRDAMCYDR